MPLSIDRFKKTKPTSTGSLLQRFVSAAVLIPIVLITVHLGGRVFSAMVAFAAIVMVFEWTRMVERKEFTPSFYALTIGAMAAFYAAPFGAYEWAYFFCGVSSAAAWLLAKRSGASGLWPALAALYILAPSIALLWLRLDIEGGRALTFIIFAIVWAADSGAFFFGKFIGGPKISYALSPSKTWAGIGGGVLGGVVAGPASAYYFIGPEAVIPFLAAGALLGAASVIGDLAESALKRRFGLKDISGFIPGHGGALDRLDGMIFVTMAMTSALYVYMLWEKAQG